MPRLIGSNETIAKAPRLHGRLVHRLDFFQAAEEVRLLKDDTGGLVVDAHAITRLGRRRRRAPGW